MRNPAFWAIAVTLAAGLTGCSATPEPVPRPTPNQLSPARSDALQQEHLDEVWASTGLPDAQRPDVTEERTIALHEWSSTIAACMTEEGIPTEADGGGVSYQSVSNAALVQYICEARYPVDAVYYDQLNESQLRFLYDYLVNDFRDCLHSYDIAVSDPPSLQSFIENYPRNGGWQPMTEVPPSQAIEVERACPQIPEGIYG
ncbi:hypothetical protein [Agromyces archimandritae]|uniref:Uncharacterized protein n=1 Tax=Agromyces archimandritae TaxID=2781962 RepID=A0A975INW2_9MICO|nr:hypothetical protein [Agromyces archimandritae]QTX03336.1 hypothetical protein G127AT_08045 [Agromyces archimandritae]